MEYKLKHGPITAVVESCGGELVSLKDSSGKEYIWQGDPQYWSGRNPHLFPIVGALANDTICFNGTAYSMSRHGFARRSEFTVVEQTDDSIVFQLQESESTLQVYPFPFTLRVRHQLTGSGFYTQFEISNPGDSALPFCIGAHTAFNCPMNAGEAFNDYRLVFDQVEDTYARLPITGGCLSESHTEHVLQNTDTIILDHTVYDRVDTLVFEGLRSTGVKLAGPDGHGVHMEFSDFPMIAFWTAPNKNAPYICLEPWHGCASFDTENGEFTDKHHCMILAPGQSTILRYTVTLI